MTDISGDFIGDREAVTIAMSICDPHCLPHSEWPTVNLIRGMCPNCYRWEGDDGVKAARELRARRLIEELDER